MTDPEAEPEAEPSPPRPPRDPAKLISGIALLGVVITVVITAALSLQEATDPTRSADIPWAGVVVLVAAVAGLVVVIASRRK